MEANAPMGNLQPPTILNGFSRVEVTEIPELDDLKCSETVQRICFENEVKNGLKLPT